MKLAKHLIALMLPVAVAGCQLGADGDGAAREVARDWADAGFNCDYQDALDYVTPESEKYLRFAASNTTEHDLELLRERPAEIAVLDDFTEANDTLRVVTLQVRNLLSADITAKEPQLIESGTFLVTVVRRDGKWRVRMEGLPRSGRQSPY